MSDFENAHIFPASGIIISSGIILGRVCNKAPIFIDSWSKKGDYWPNVIVMAVGNNIHKGGVDGE